MSILNELDPIATDAVASPAAPKSGYANSDALVSTAWLAANLTNPDIVIIESDEDVLLYDTGHILGAHHVDWRRDLNDQTIRDYISPAEFAALASRLGITPDTTVVFYGDKSNWWAAYALWIFHLFGHTKTKILDGGRNLWQNQNRPWTRDVPRVVPTNYPVPSTRLDHEIRAFYEETLAHSKAGLPLVDVRSPQEYTGLVTHMPEYPQEGVLRGGHIPGAKSVPWSLAVTEKGTFKSADRLREIYEGIQDLRETDEVIVYCRIGERSSHTWFVLTQLLGYKNVRNYDGSWTEWGNRVRSPIEVNRRIS